MGNFTSDKITKPFMQNILEDWQKADYSMLINSRASDYIKKIRLIRLINILVVVSSVRLI